MGLFSVVSLKSAQQEFKLISARTCSFWCNWQFVKRDQYFNNNNNNNSNNNKTFNSNSIKHSAEWIKREKQKYADTECKPWEDISQDELQTVLKKASNWKSPGPDAVPNFWLKQLTALHQHLLNAYNQAIENPENLPDWFTTAQTYLLPKNKDTENP